MSKAKKKYYVVWVGGRPGVYDSWTECQLQTNGYEGARFKSFDTMEEAVEAYRGDPTQQLGMMRQIIRHTGGDPLRPLPSEPRDYTVIPGIRLDAIAVDGACSGNPGKMEYRGVRVIDGKEMFHVGDKYPLTGTNNIAEYLAMIHVAALLKRSGDTHTPIYTDSKNTFAWLRRGGSHTTLPRNEATAMTWALLDRADAWLKANGPIVNPILKWKTEEWGEIPADFDRKH